jgi:2-methylisocitrate lyase-like PEP mutase family enzyme
LISYLRDRTAQRLYADRGPHRSPRLAWLDDAIARGYAFARDGADIVFVEAPGSEAE